MTVELDHLFICTERPAPAADALRSFGLSEGMPNRHPGQGTANRRFFFHNAFLELLWVDNPSETQSAAVARTGLWERWSRRGADASPFGVCLRVDDAAARSFSNAIWEYRPDYLPEPLAIYMAEHSLAYTHPLLFAITFGRRPDSDAMDRRQPLEHRAGLRAITSVRISVMERDHRIAADWLAIAGLGPAITLEEGSQHLLEIGFDGVRQARSHDFRPGLPLIFRW